MPHTTRKILSLREPVWVTERGDKIPLSQIKNDHLKRIERWLRGCGRTDRPAEMQAFWYGTIQAELVKRRLDSLPPHPNSETLIIKGIQHVWNQRTHTWEPDADNIREEI